MDVSLPPPFRSISTAAQKRVSLSTSFSVPPSTSTQFTREIHRAPSFLSFFVAPPRSGVPFPLVPFRVRSILLTCVPRQLQGSTRSPSSPKQKRHAGRPSASQTSAMKAPRGRASCVDSCRVHLEVAGPCIRSEINPKVNSGFSRRGGGRKGVKPGFSSRGEEGRIGQGDVGLGEIRGARWIKFWINWRRETQRIRIWEKGRRAQARQVEMALQRHRVQPLDQVEGTVGPSWINVVATS